MANYARGTKDSALCEVLGKLEHDSQDSAQTRSHVELIYATMSPMCLNASTLSNPNSLCISLVSPLACTLDHLQPIPIQTLVDSRSIHCFLDFAFACGHSLPTTTTPPVELCLFDGTSNNIISEVVSLPVKFFKSGIERVVVTCQTTQLSLINTELSIFYMYLSNNLTRYISIDNVQEMINYLPQPDRHRTEETNYSADKTI